MNEQTASRLLKIGFFVSVVAWLVLAVLNFDFAPYGTRSHSPLAFLTSPLVFLLLPFIAALLLRLKYIQASIVFSAVLAIAYPIGRVLLEIVK